MKNEFYISFNVQQEQIEYAKELVEYSLKNHPISNIWDKEKKEETEKLRMIGTLGEIIFADIYKLPRPSRSFGAIDGQDFGKDFQLKTKTQTFNVDIKTMRRKDNRFYKNYVLNIPARNINRTDSLTDYYFCISLHEKDEKTTASLLGIVSKKEIIDGKIGILYKKGTKRKRADKTFFTFYEDTYEVFFENISRPFINKRIQSLPSFKKHVLR
ncbi:MAG: hypothetical protein JXL97_13905 [Bacteroidales bacterium]|nr:hypothetical protein [Bacteroidales bacterium]